MKVVVAVVGRVRGLMAEPVEEYEARAGRYWKLDVIEVASGASRKSAAPDVVMDAEAARLLARIPTELELVALTPDGKGMDSRALSRYLDRHAVHGSSGVAFVVGGAFGLGASVLERAQRRLSLSAMTFPHEMARLVLAEQLYRAGTILRGEPYHKG